MPNSIKKIAFVGPESTGKTSLCKELSVLFKEPWVKEMSRDYLENFRGKYTINDILEISKLQLTQEKLEMKFAKKFLFCDTNSLVNIVWAKYVFDWEGTELTSNYYPKNYNHHFLCDIDVPWQFDPLREHPNNRKEIFELYKFYLEKWEIPYSILSGSLENRISVVSKIILEL